MQSSTIDIIGVPVDYGGNRRGVDMGPSAIRYSGLETQLKALGLAVRDFGDIHIPVPETQLDQENSRLGHVKAVAQANADLFRLVAKSHADEHFPLILGGDHSIAVGSALASASHFADIGIIWADAHGDFNTAETTTSGNLHGMPLTSITGVETGTLAAALPEGIPIIRPENTVILGARSLDPGESELLKRSGVTVFSMQDIDHQGMQNIVKQAIKIAGKKARGFHVSFDLDVISPKEAPGVGTPVKGGITYREAHLLMEMLYASGRMLSLDVVELNPITDHSNVTGELAVSLILSALGKNIY